jgi:squalene-hopene/tetraprenyl-beta-curcumene cyclase
MKSSLRVVLTAGIALMAVALGIRLNAGGSDPGWDPKAAAGYLDGRAEWWTTWSNAARDRGTYCMSCHTTLPYALARPELRAPLGERGPSATEEKILGNLLTRARSWREIEPWYPDQTRGIPKTSESRAIEAVMNALILSRRDAHAGKTSDDLKTAFNVMWSLQMKTGPESGAWTWLNFKMEPWESPNSPYFGASMAALAIGSAPQGYATSPEIADRVKALGGYFQKQHANVSLLNQLYALWGTSRMPSLLTGEQRKATVDAAFAKQQPDGGWSTAAIGSYKRMDESASDVRTDGFATALATLALQAAGVPRSDPRLAKGLDWLTRNQDRASGRWVAVSPNKERDPQSDAGKFMSDAATAYAVMSLTYQN